jgi:hypothetical protein
MQYCTLVCTTIYVSSYCYICVLILLYMSRHTTIYVSSYCYMCRHTAICVSSYCYICVLMLLYMCPHTAMYVCVLILLCMCPHSAMYVSSYCYLRVLILLCMCPHSAVYVSSYCNMCPHTAYMCPHTATYVSSYYFSQRRSPPSQTVTPPDPPPLPREEGQPIRKDKTLKWSRNAGELFDDDYFRSRTESSSSMLRTNPLCC